MAQDAILGCIFMFAGSCAPRGYALCQGQMMSIAQNTALFSILGTTYGGNGVQTFGVPDLRGRAPIGQGPGPGLAPVALGELAGTQNVTLASGNMPLHTHAVTVTVNAAADGRASTDSPAGAVPDSTGGTNIYAAAPDGSTTMNAGMITTQVAAA